MKMRVVINKCHGGFGLSAKALRRLAELQGKECHFYQIGMSRKYEKFEPIGNEIMFLAFSSGDEDEIRRVTESDDWGQWTKEQKEAHNSAYDALKIDIESNDRTNPMLIQIIEEMGDEANSRFSKLKIVEIPDGIEYEIQEYDGSEWIAEKHRTWE